MRITSVAKTFYAKPIRYIAIGIVVIGVIALIGYIWKRFGSRPTPALKNIKPNDQPLPPLDKTNPLPQCRKRSQSIPSGFSPATFGKNPASNSKFKFTITSVQPPIKEPFTPLRPNDPKPLHDQEIQDTLDEFVAWHDCEGLRELEACSVENIRKLHKTENTRQKVLERLAHNPEVKRFLFEHEKGRIQSLRKDFLSTNKIAFKQLRTLEILLTPRLLKLRRQVQGELREQNTTDAGVVDENVIQRLAANPAIQRTIKEATDIAEQHANALSLMREVKKEGLRMLGGVRPFNRAHPPSPFKPQTYDSPRPAPAQVVRSVVKTRATPEQHAVRTTMEALIGKRRKSIQGLNFGKP